jgi:hypothetical protein
VRRSTLLVALAVGLGAACVPTTVVRTDLAERRWYAVETSHVTLYTDLDAARADDLARNIEIRHRVLGEIYAGMLAPGRSLPSARIVVVHLESCLDLRPLWGDDISGQAAITADFVRRRTVLTCEERHDFTDVIVTHELAHQMNVHFFPTLPPWLEEGLATYVQSLFIDRDRIVLGDYPLTHHKRGVRRPDLGALRAMAHDEFRALDDNYLSAWRAVHMLATGSDDYRQRFQRLLRGIGDGTAAAAAWDAAFGDLPQDRLDAEYRTHFQRGHHDTWVMPYHRQPPPEVQRRTLAAGEIQDVWIQTLATFGKPSTDHAEQQVAAAERAVPGWTGAGYWRAVLAVRAGRPDREVEDLLRRHVARAPDDVRGWTALMQLQLDLVAGDELAPEPPPGLDELRDELAALQPHGRSAPALDAMARFFAVARKPGPGEGLARRAVAVDPTCADCETTLALLLFQRGAFGDAAAHQERALRLLGESTAPPSWLRRLAHYRQRATAR